MDSGDSDNKIILIKQEVESNEINETVDVANIKFEQEDATYGIQCDGVKVENLKLKYQDESESGMFNPEYVWVDSKQEEVWKAESEKIDAIVSDSSQPTEESGNIESNTNAETTYDPEQHRMKVELTDENWCSIAIDGDIQVKTEVKSEKLEDEAYMVPKFEQMDTLDLNEEVDIKPDGDPITTSDSDCAPKKKKWETELQVEHKEVESELCVCYGCNFRASSKIQLINHIKSDKCSIQTVSKIFQTETSFSCKKCFKVFRTKRTLDDHVIKKHIECIDSVSCKIHECSHCDYKTTNKNSANRHMVTHPGLVPKLCICEHCNASFLNQLLLDNHTVQKHPKFITTVKSYIHACTDCSYKSTVVKYFKQHIWSHSSDKPGECKHCTATFKTKRGLNGHIVKKHPNFSASTVCKIYECSYCEFKTIQKISLDRHMANHPNAANSYNLLTFRHCATFTRKKILNDHIIKKRPDSEGSLTEKIHECSYCSYKTTDKQYLTEHMRTHSSDKPNTCKRCLV